jgi:hypothetical protein
VRRHGVSGLRHPAPRSLTYDVPLNWGTGAGHTNAGPDGPAINQLQQLVIGTTAHDSRLDECECESGVGGGEGARSGGRALSARWRRRLV